MVNSIVGVSIFRLPSDLSAKTGSLSPLSCLAAGVGILIIAACIAEVSSYYDQTGGLYLYARDALGKFAGLIVAWLTWLTRIAAPAAAANLFCSYFAHFFPAAGTPIGAFAVMSVLIGHLMLLNYFGVNTGKTISNFFAVGKTGFLLMFVLAGALALLIKPDLHVPFQPAAIHPANWFAAMLLLVYAYGGFEGALSVGGESENPKRDTPFALLGALAVVCLLYTAVQSVVVFTLPAAEASTTPLADAAHRVIGPAAANLITLAALVSAYGYLSANLLHAPRITFAMAEHGEFPRIFVRIHPRYQTPYVSILIYGGLVLAFATFGNFEWNAVLSAVSRLAIYAAMAIAVPLLRSRTDRQGAFRLPVPYLFSGLALLFSLVLLTQMGRAEFLVTAITCGIAILNWVFAQRV